MLNAACDEEDGDQGFSRGCRGSIGCDRGYIGILWVLYKYFIGVI